MKELAKHLLEHAIADYSAGEFNLGEAAARAGVTVGRQMAELDARGVDTITPAHFRASLEHLSEAFGESDELRSSLAEL